MPSQHKEAPRVTPLPAGQLFILCVVLITESVASTMLIPFVGYFVVYLQGWTPKQAGYAAGFLIGLFMLGQMASSKVFGTASDYYGRKFTISVGVAGCAVMMFLFGLSPNIYVACLWRFCHGLFAGCSLVAKTMISDITDRTNQAKGFALVSLTWGMGTLFGPSLGGILYDPANNLTWLHCSPDGFMAHHPAFLPCTVLAAYNLFAVGISVFFLNESNKRARPLHTMFSPALGEKLKPYLKFIQPHLPADDAVKAESVTVVVTVPDEATPGAATPANNGSSTPAPRDDPVHKRPLGFAQAFADPVLRKVLIICMLVSCTDMAFAEIFPLWEIAPTESGGLALSSKQVGMILFVGAAPHITANVIFPTVLSYIFKDKAFAFWEAAQFIYGFLSFLMPFSFYAGRLWLLPTMTIFIIRKFSEAWCFSTLNLIVAQVAPPGEIGLMYGVQQFTSCMVRCVVPFVFAPLFAWSIAKPRVFPLNQHLTFLLTMLPMIPFGVYMCHTIVLPPGPEADDDDSGGSDEDYRGSTLHHSFRGVQGDPTDTILINNSFASLANSFSHNMVGGLLQPSIIEASTQRDGGLALLMSSSTSSAASESSDSRDASSQANDEFVETPCSSNFGNDMAALSIEQIDNEDERARCESDEEPVAAENWF